MYLERVFPDSFAFFLIFSFSSFEHLKAIAVSESPCDLLPEPSRFPPHAIVTIKTREILFFGFFIVKYFQDDFS